ncbi:MAG TPA: BamA/TamA family outer membrane protein, partial [Cytophagales bacterium]|nr:BamA/TamA family outer membrane protein [Cytophagales bacterium]
HHQIKFDSLVLDSPSKTKTAYLQSLFGIRKGALYSQYKVEEIAQIISRQPFIALEAPPYVVFKYNKAYVHLKLREQKSTSFNGIIGYLPDVNRKRNTLVGEVQARFNNIFGMGVRYDLNWQRFQSKSQDLKTSLFVPYVLKSPIGIRVKLQVLKQDTTFVNISRKIAFEYRLNNHWTSALSYELNTSAVNSNEPKGVQVYMPNTSRLYGLSLEYNTAHEVFFPRKGAKILMEINLGNKTLNAETTPASNKNSTQFSGMLRGVKIIKFGQRAALVIQQQQGLIWNNKDAIFINDLYRLGGINDLRGFNEKAFFVDKYILNTVEYRFLVRSDSYLNIFVDQAIIHVPEEKKKNQIPMGAGLGYVFKTPIGFMRIYYSVGKSQYQALNIQNSKIHFAISNEF